MVNRILLALLLLACGFSVAHAQPLDFEHFFSGRLTGTGTVDNVREGTHRPFTATLDGVWNGPHGTVTEDLTYADGETRRFAWTFDRAGDNRWAGHRDDLAGDADVRLEGDALRMTYKAHTRVPSGSIWTLSFDDRFEQVDPRTVTLKGAVSYFFLNVGATQMRIVKGR